MVGGREGGCRRPIDRSDPCHQPKLRSSISWSTVISSTASYSHSAFSVYCVRTSTPQIRQKEFQVELFCISSTDPPPSAAPPPAAAAVDLPVRWSRGCRAHAPILIDVSWQTAVAAAQRALGVRRVCTIRLMKVSNNTQESVACYRIPPSFLPSLPPAFIPDF